MSPSSRAVVLHPGLVARARGLEARAVDVLLGAVPHLHHSVLKTSVAANKAQHPKQVSQTPTVPRIGVC